MIVLLAGLSAHAGGPPSCPTPPGPIDGAEHLFDIQTFGTQIEIVPTVDAYWPCAYAVRWSVLRGDETLHDLPVGRSLVDVGEYGEYTVVLRAETLGGVGEEAVTVTLEPDKNGCSTVHPRGGLAVLGLVIATAFRRRTRPESGRAARNSSEIGAR